MKIVRLISAILISVFMFVYMMLASSLFAIDLSLDENYIADVLNSSDSFAKLVRSTELSIDSNFEKNTEELVENFGGSAGSINFEEIYSLPEAYALFADVFTGSMRFILYNEDYSIINNALIEDYLCAVAEYTTGREIPEQEIEDYLSVSLDVYTEKFSRSVSSAVDSLTKESEMLDTLRFIFNDVKFISMTATVLHMLVLILLIRGRTGYFFNAAVFGLSGIAMFTLAPFLEKSLRRTGTARYSRLITEIVRGRFQILGAILFAVFTAFMVIAFVKYIRRTKAES